MSQEDYEKQFNKERVWFGIFIFLAICAPILAYFLPWRPEGLSLSNWFSRSGAAMVVLSLLAEANAIKVFNIFNPSGFARRGINEFRAKYYDWPSAMNRTAFTLIAIGTLIWGYGDIPISNA
jgi:di/tricarboxylate transporter